MSRVVTVNDKMQSGYRYELAVPSGRDFNPRPMPGEDARQIGRWKAVRRHVSQLRNHCEPGNPMCRSGQRQALLHWAYDSRII